MKNYLLETIIAIVLILLFCFFEFVTPKNAYPLQMLAFLTALIFYVIARSPQKPTL